jgi:hypothetical protein
MKILFGIGWQNYGENCGHKEGRSLLATSLFTLSGIIRQVRFD